MQAGNNTRIITLIFQCKLSLEPNEIDPEVMVWTSAEESPKYNYELVSLDPKDEQKKYKIDIGVSQNPHWPQDAAVHFQLFAKTPELNQKNKIYISDQEWENDVSSKPYYEKVGATFVLFRDIIEAQRQSTRTQGIFIVQSCASEVEEEITKGFVFPECDFKSTTLPVFHPQTRFDIVPENVDTIRLRIQQYIETKLLHSYNVLPSYVPEVKAIHAPIFLNSTQITLPSYLFWDNRAMQSANGNQLILSRLLHIAIKRYQWTTKRFINAIESQFKSKTLLNDFLMVLRIIATSFTCITNAMAYVPDLANISVPESSGDTGGGEGIIVVTQQTATIVQSTDEMNEKRNIIQVHQKGFLQITVDSYSDPLLDNGGDCEDDGWFEGSILFRRLRDATDLDLDFLILAQQVVRLYKGFGILGSVLQRSFEESHTQGTTSLAAGSTPKSPIIGSSEDMEPDTGAHITFILVPKKNYVQMVNRGIDKQHQKVVYESQKYPWESELPVLLCEGTGYLDPLPLPQEAYYKSPKDKLDAAKLEILKHEAIRRIIIPEDNPAFNDCSYLRGADSFKYEPNIRFNNSFFRFQTEMYPIPESGEQMEYPFFNDEFTKEHLDRRQFTREFLVGTENKFGCDMHYILSKNPKAALYGIEPPDEIVWKYMCSICKQLPPPEVPQVPQESTNEIAIAVKDQYEISKKQFVIQTTKYGKNNNKGGGGGGKSKTTLIINLFWRQYNFTPQVAKEVGDILAKNPDVVNLNIILEHMTDDLAVVRVEVKVDYSTWKFNEEEIKKALFS